MRNHFDLTPLFRSTVGFDRLNDLFDSAMTREEHAAAYPPYNIEKLGENEYSITMAVAGFTESDIEITAQENLLVVSGRVMETEEDKERTYLHKGIATRAFERKFSLADHVKVVGAKMENGLLT
ncbi:MAG: Hsp20 family protein, partial [Rickettsiales bacterium]